MILAGDPWPVRLLLLLAAVPDVGLVHSALGPIDFGSTDYVPGLLSAPVAVEAVAAPAPDEPPP